MSISSKNWLVVREKLVSLDEIIVVLSGVEDVDLVVPFAEEETKIQAAIEEDCLLIT